MHPYLLTPTAVKSCQRPDLALTPTETQSDFRNTLSTLDWASGDFEVSFFFPSFAFGIPRRFTENV